MLFGFFLSFIHPEGRLNQPSLNLLEGADIQFRREHRLDIALVKNLPLALIFLPAADIPTFVGEGQCDLGITGLDQVKEHDAHVRASPRARLFSGDIVSSSLSSSADGSGAKIPGCEVVMELGFGSCKLQVQAPEKGAYQSSRDLIGKSIGTSFVKLAEEHFARLEAEEFGPTSGWKLRTKIIQLSGSVEAACALGVADGIVDLVGESCHFPTLPFPLLPKKPSFFSHLNSHASSKLQLSRITRIRRDDARMRPQGRRHGDGQHRYPLKSRSPSNPELLDLIASRIGGVITAQKYVLCQYNIERKRLAEATKITRKEGAHHYGPGGGRGVCVSAMVEKKRIAPVMDELTRVARQMCWCLTLQIVGTS